ncbi:lipopolysaccharide biosynthesis protein [Rossellomorea marisflavi]|uniref:lipopolysaccharide biosynthesis protein n=1 Tax=Rossellomorea marisflavi TaxID=189381 RepID=UPI001EE1B1A6|nr:sugar translocase [Rossellomorea marisflavi]UKS64970.1 sugar translocase [Rossellomorea marisflavi]
MRTYNSFRNVTISFFGQILAMLIAFPARYIFIKTLGVEYLGLNSLFINIVTILSLADLGIGSAIVYSLYAPLAKKNENTIMGLMNFYKKAYTVIGIVVFVFGVLILPFVSFFTSTTTIPYVHFIFFLFVINTTISYFYAYKRSIVIANQKNYIINTIHYSSIVLLNIFQVLILLITKNFVLFLVIQILMTLLENLLISKVANKMFPFLKNKNKISISNEEKTSIFANVRAILLHKFGGAILQGTDNIVISLYLGVYWVGLYSNYILVVNAIIAIFNQIYNSVTASVGNLLVTEDTKRNFNIFKNLLFINFWIVGFCSISLWILINPFINLWLGEAYVLNSTTIVLIVINFYLFSFRNTALLFKNAAGLFRQDKYKPIIEGGLNIILSVLFVNMMGLNGVLLGTIISMILTSFWIEPYIVFKHVFLEKVSRYYFKILYYTIFNVMVGSIVWCLIQLLPQQDLFSFCIKALICLVIPNFLFAVFSFKTQEFKYFSNLILKFLKIRRKSYE